MIGRTESREQLAAVYSAADAFFNPTQEDNYPTVNLEAEACGTPVVTYDTGGSAESVGLISDVVFVGDFANAVKCIHSRQQDSL
ncbi:glycosyltransferase [Adlercreutzia sp. ZJ242]|uniref:glycosyltransferase n=1 Tax=Adlercreutzia sp. ZJ242 TaxID=2709409 RepID=UPI0013ED23D9|nr:glycosyltransferase [Adlercreutzia sp. ZJ242]